MIACAKSTRKGISGFSIVNHEKTANKPCYLINLKGAGFTGAFFHHVNDQLNAIVISRCTWGPLLCVIDGACLADNRDFNLPGVLHPFFYLLGNGTR